MDIDNWVDSYIELYSSEQEFDDDHPLWWAFEKTIFCLHRKDTEQLWSFVLLVLSKQPNARVLCNLAAGPLEDLIAYDGENFIDRIELNARQNPAFKELLGGVWRNQTNHEIWERVEKCRSTDS